MLDIAGSQPNEFYYKIKVLTQDETFPEFVNPRIHLLQYEDINDYQKAVYSLIQYNNALQNYTGNLMENTKNDVKAKLEQFQKVFKFWSEESENDEFVLIMLEENLPQISEFLRSLKKVEDFHQANVNIDDICTEYSKTCGMIYELRSKFGVLKNFVNFSFQGTLWREKSSI